MKKLLKNKRVAVMLSKKRQEQIHEVVSDVFYEEYKRFENPPEFMSEDEKEFFTKLGELDASISTKLNKLFDTWKRG